MNNNGNRPRRSTGKGILDMHPTQLRRGEGTNINPEQLNILKIKTEERIAAVEKAKRNDVLRKVSEMDTPNAQKPQNIYQSRPCATAADNVINTSDVRRSSGTVDKNKVSGNVKYTDPYIQTPSSDTYGNTRQEQSAYTVPTPVAGSSKKAVIIILSIVFVMILIAGTALTAIFIHGRDGAGADGSDTEEQFFDPHEGASAGTEESRFNNIGINF